MSHETELERFVEKELDDLYVNDDGWLYTIENKANALFNIVEYVKENYIAKD